MPEIPETPNTLTPEEWHAMTLDLFGNWVQARINEKGGMRLNWDLLTEPGAEYIDVDASSRHALAALCLYQQPFGFDADDLAWLKRMSFFTLDHAEAEAHQAWLQSFIARHAALLPPLPPPEGR